MSQFLSNIGPADELRDRVTKALRTNSPLFLELDAMRGVRIIHIHTSSKDNEVGVECSDIVDGTTVILHLPYAADTAARADIIFN